MVKAKDIYDYESEWSDPLSVYMPRSKNLNSFFIKFLERFPKICSILQFVLC
jgi:hypothetical protein